MVGETSAPVAAIDLGSNSFFMLLATLDHGQLSPVDKLRERVALATGLSSSQTLRADAKARALACLARFRERIQDLPPEQCRAVGTKALREAKNSQAFLEEAEKALGTRIEVISGREEARLIYLGVSQAMGRADQRTLIIDIGGGSTECILGEGESTLLLDSLSMGCVTYSERFFPGGRIDDAALNRAELAAALELEGIAARYKAFGWKAALGTSGTMQAIESILLAEGWANGRGCINLKGLRRLRKAMLAQGDVHKLKLKGLPQDRGPVLAGGIAILLAIFELFGLERMQSSPAGLREGVALDLLGSGRRRNVREQAVQSWLLRYRVDESQSLRVERTAMKLFSQVASAWKLDEESGQLLAWGARLHELGQAVAYSGYHKHGAYLIANGELPGFSREEQATLAALVRCHRRRFAAERFADLPPRRRRRAMRLALLLRVAVALHRSRRDSDALEFRAHVGKGALMLEFEPGVLAAHPLTRAALEEVSPKPAPGKDNPTTLPLLIAH